MDDQERNRLDAIGDYDDGLSLQLYLDALRRYRRLIYTAVAAMSAVFVVGVLVLFVLFPSQQIVSVPFRLQFDGAALGHYPNREPFRPTDIATPSVVEGVFKANGLQKYGSAEGLKDSLFVQPTTELDRLADQYRLTLADPKLTAVDRTRIEAEFAAKQAALADPGFSISLRRSERFVALPDDLAEKVLNDTLAAWATQAEGMGAMKYQLPALANVALSKESLDREDYMVAVDKLRAKAVRLSDVASALEEVGVLVTRTSKDGVSLAEIGANMDDLVRLNLDQLLGIIRSEGVTKNAKLLALWTSNEVFDRQADRQAAEGRARAVQNALAVYTAQRGPRTSSLVKPAAAGGARTEESNTSVEMSGMPEKGDMEYRQRLTDRIIAEDIRVTELDRELVAYQGLLKSLQGIGSRPAGSEEAVNLVKTRIQEAFSAIENAANQLVEISSGLSAKDSNPAAPLYATAGPLARHTERALSYRTILLSFVLMLMLTLGASTAGCLIFDAMKRRSVTP